MPTMLYLIRHGEVHNPDDILYGRLPDFHLSKVGQEQARAASQHLQDKPLAAIFSSPMQRAQETAQFIAQSHLDITVQTDERLNEVHTPWDGKPRAELIARGFDLYTGSSPEFEQPEQIGNRLLSFFVMITQEYHDKEVVAVTHGDLVVFALMIAKQVPLKVENKHNLVALGLPEEYPATASISTLTFSNNDKIPQYQYIRPY